MENKKLKILDGTLEMAIRLLCILRENPKPMNPERLIAYDYFCMFPADADSTRMNFHPVTSYRSCSFIGENRTINSSLHLLLTKNLVKLELVDSKAQYSLTKLGEIFIDSIDTKYMISLRESVKWVCAFFSYYTAEELNSFVQTHIENWNFE
jgi:hypothetical protein